MNGRMKMEDFFSKSETASSPNTYTVSRETITHPTPPLFVQNFVNTLVVRDQMSSLQDFFHRKADGGT